MATLAERIAQEINIIRTNELTTKININDIGVTVQPFSSNSVSDPSYVSTDENFTTTLLAKLNAIEEFATADQTAAEIKSLYEGEVNAFTDALFTKLSGIETAATADQSAAEIKSLYEGEVKAFTDALFDKLAGIETGATADQNYSEIKALYESNLNTNEFSDAEQSKLANIESGSQVTSYAHVKASGAVMEDDVSTNNMDFVIDEDSLASNSASKIPTQQSVKAYVDANIASALSSEMSYKGGYNASTNVPNLDSAASGVNLGDMYTVTTAGTFFTTGVAAGDVLIANVADADSESEWTIAGKNQDAASIKAAYEGNSNTNEFSDAEQSKLANIATAANKYIHPTYAGDDINVDTGALSGATVISDLDFNVTTDTSGHVTDANAAVITRNITLADLGFTGATNANNYSLPLANATTRGGIELFSNTDNPTAANGVSSTAGRTYGVQLNSSNQAVVNVPWVDTNTNTVYTHPTYSGDDINIDTGPLSGATVISDLDFNVTTDTSGHVTDANATYSTRTITLANLGFTGAANANNFTYTLPFATATTRGGIELFSNTDNPTGANSVSATAGRTYGIQLNSANQAVVNVPWVDTNTDTNTWRAISSSTSSTSTTVSASSSAVRAAYNLAAGKAPSAHNHTYVKYGSTVKGTAVSGGFNVTGEFVASGNVTAYSDERLKTDFQPISSALDKCCSITGYTFERTDEVMPRQVGFKAQDVEAILPEAVHTGDDVRQTKSLNYGAMGSLYVEAIKELKAKNDALEARLAALEAKL